MAAASLMGVVLTALLSISTVENTLVTGVMGILLGGGVYLGAAWLMGVQELRAIVLPVLQRLRRG
jgi:hypothetical protein